MKQLRLSLFLAFACILAMPFFCLCQEQELKQKVQLPYKFFEWKNPGADPYIKGGAKTRGEMADRMRDRGQDIVLIELQKMGLSRSAAIYLWEKLIDPQSSGVMEWNIRPGEFLSAMLFGGGVVSLVKVMTELPTYGGEGNAWKVIIPQDLGGREVLIPKICINICLNPFPLSPPKEITLKVPPAEPPGQAGSVVIIDNSVRITNVDTRSTVDKRSTVNRPVAPPAPPLEQKKKGWSWAKTSLIAGAIAGTGVAIYFATRDREAPTPITPVKTGVTTISPAFAAGFSIQFR